MGPVEIPFILLAAYCLKRFGWKLGCAFTFAVLWAPGPLSRPHTRSHLVFLKNALTGMVIGGGFLSTGRFAYRLAIASAPGVLVAGLYGLPLVYGGVPDTILEDIRREAGDIYNSFMSPDDAKNAAENAALMIKEVFGVGSQYLS